MHVNIMGMVTDTDFREQKKSDIDILADNVICTEYLHKHSHT